MLFFCAERSGTVVLQLAPRISRDVCATPSLSVPFPLDRPSRARKLRPTNARWIREQRGRRAALNILYTYGSPLLFRERLARSIIRRDNSDLARRVRQIKRRSAVRCRVMKSTKARESDSYVVRAPAVLGMGIFIKKFAIACDLCTQRKMYTVFE